MKMFNLPADCNAVDIGANDGEILFIKQLEYKL